jgi:hypothetical protein
MMLSSLTPLTDYHFITLRLRLVCTGNLIRVAEVRELPTMFAPSHGRKSTICTRAFSISMDAIQQLKTNEEMWMNAAESKSLKKGNRVYWRGDANDGGIITEMSWDAVTIAWDNGHVATVHHGDMREIQRARAKPTVV